MCFYDKQCLQGKAGLNVIFEVNTEGQINDMENSIHNVKTDTGCFHSQSIFYLS